jgi:hypothetical protein
MDNEDSKTKLLLSALLWLIGIMIAAGFILAACLLYAKILFTFI